MYCPTEDHYSLMEFYCFFRLYIHCSCRVNSRISLHGLRTVSWSETSLLTWLLKVYFSSFFWWLFLWTVHILVLGILLVYSFPGFITILLRKKVLLGPEFLEFFKNLRPDQFLLLSYQEYSRSLWFVFSFFGIDLPSKFLQLLFWQQMD